MLLELLRLKLMLMPSLCPLLETMAKLATTIAISFTCTSTQRYSLKIILISSYHSFWLSIHAFSPLLHLLRNLILAAFYRVAIIPATISITQLLLVVSQQQTCWVLGEMHLGRSGLHDQLEYYHATGCWQHQRRLPWTLRGDCRSDQVAHPRSITDHPTVFLQRNTPKSFQSYL